ncbi:MAG: NAD(P)-binding domain-containing protein [Candidatus Eremiobacteraeota bacterium]|nr:NAD(P)-binding domain-containing protein [Candidatus Eremiobacteraeota bacterium]
MKVGVLGSGEVGQSLARGFVSRGNDVMIGSRDPAKLADFAKDAGCKAGSFSETARFGEILVLATLGRATPSAIEQAGQASFSGKVVIDATNPLVFGEGRPTLDPSGADSGGEQNQRAAPQAKIVKAFNTVGNKLFVDPQLPGGPPTMFIAGDDAEAKRHVRGICESFGWDVADMGPLSSSRYLEAMCLAWVLYGFVNNDWSPHAFKMLKG